MANTFKIKSNDAMPASAGTFDTLYTVLAATTSVVLGLILCNIHTTAVTASVKMSSNTVDVETNVDTLIVKDVDIPAGSSLEVLSGSKIVLQTTDLLKIDCSVSAKIDATLSIMAIT